MPARHLLSELRAEHDQLIEQFDRFEQQLKAWHANNNVSQRLASIPGIGVLTASALAATVGEGWELRNGRQLAAYLGLVPPSGFFGWKGPAAGNQQARGWLSRGLLIHGA